MPFLVLGVQRGTLPGAPKAVVGVRSDILLVFYELTTGFKFWVQGHPAIDEDGCSLHVVGGIRGEPDRHSANFIRLTNALRRNQLHQVAIGFGSAPSLLVDRRTDGARRNAVHANAVASDF